MRFGKLQSRAYLIEVYTLQPAAIAGFWGNEACTFSATHSVSVRDLRHTDSPRELSQILHNVADPCLHGGEVVGVVGGVEF